MVYGFGLLLGARRAARVAARGAGALADSPRCLKLAAWAWPLPFLINSAGWVMTEMGRQPWIVQGLLQTNGAQSPSVSTLEVWITLLGFTAVYAVLGGIALLDHPARGARGPRARAARRRRAGDADLSLAY